MTLTGPSRTIIVEPIEVPERAAPEQAPDPAPAEAPEGEPGSEPTPVEPERAPA